MSRYRQPPRSVCKVRLWGTIHYQIFCPPLIEGHLKRASFYEGQVGSWKFREGPETGHGDWRWTLGVSAIGLRLLQQELSTAVVTKTRTESRRWDTGHQKRLLQFLINMGTWCLILFEHTLFLELLSIIMGVVAARNGTRWAMCEAQGCLDVCGKNW